MENDTAVSLRVLFFFHPRVRVDERDIIIYTEHDVCVHVVNIGRVYFNMYYNCNEDSSRPEDLTDNVPGAYSSEERVNGHCRGGCNEPCSCVRRLVKVFKVSIGTVYSVM